MEKLELRTELQKHFPEAEFPENTPITEMVISKDKIHEVAATLKAEEALSFDYLISMTAVDWKEKMTLVYHLESIKHRHVLVLKADVADREDPQINTVSDIWPTANPHECEVFDLFGIRFNNHPALRRLFLEDDYGYPLRKDFRDEVNFIER